VHTTPISLLVRLQQPPGLEESSPGGQRTWQEAWGHFVKLYVPLLYGWARRVGLQTADAEDLIAEVLRDLVRTLPTFRYDPERGRFRSWLIKVLHNKLKQIRRRDHELILLRNGDSPLSDVSVADDVEAISEAEYRQYVARRALELMRAEFEPRTWQACWETAANGRQADEVAAELGMTRDAVYKAKSRVLERLRQELDGLLDC
jgi:RNA polymerase sigma-70 factor (ECF subfamily)